METIQNFANISAAFAWLCQNCGLWKGLSQDDQDGIWDMLDQEGRACVRTPKGDVFIATVP